MREDRNNKFGEYRDACCYQHQLKRDLEGHEHHQLCPNHKKEVSLQKGEQRRPYLETQNGLFKTLVSTINGSPKSSSRNFKLSSILHLGTGATTGNTLGTYDSVFQLN